MSAYSPIQTAPRVRQWTSDRRVRRILRSFADRPAPLASIPSHERWTRHTETYTGFRVACLAILRDAILTPQFRAAEAADDYDLAKAIIAQPSVADAVEQAHYVRIPTLVPLTTTARQIAPDAWAYARMEDTFSAPLNQITGRV